MIDALDALLEPHLFPVRADGSNPRVCPACTDGRIGLKFVAKHEDGGLILPDVIIERAKTAPPREPKPEGDRDRDRRAPFATPRFLPRSRVRNTTMRSASPSLYVRRINASAVYSGTN